MVVRIPKQLDIPELKSSIGIGFFYHLSILGIKKPSSSVLVTFSIDVLPYKTAMLYFGNKCFSV
jgi:hypothetical protein